MGEKTYVCNRYPFLSIGETVHFKDGVFVTSNPAEQALIERNDWWLVFIHPGKLEHLQEALGLEPETVPLVEPPPSDKPLETKPPVAHRGLRGTGARKKKKG